MFKTLAAKFDRDKDMPPRVWKLAVLRSVLDGTLYDVLKYSFQEERSSSNEYIPLRDRRPSVRHNLCRTVVHDSISLLFGDQHFPTVELSTPKDQQQLAKIIKDTKLPQVMNEAALRGSVGSVVILMRVLNGRIFFNAMDTDFLTPEYDPQEPDTLLSVTEKYKVKGETLRASGYDIANDDLTSDFWFQRVWDRSAENWYSPVKVAYEFRQNPFRAEVVDEQKEPEIDQQRTVTHKLGFVPMVWIKNLPGCEGIDGACTYHAAIETQIEIEYQLSQAGRGLKYSADPLLMLREPASGEEGSIIRSASNAVIVDENGDAKTLEINGTAASAVIEYVKTLREAAVESIHGNRSNADKLSAAQSGRAMEMMHQPLIWLADQLRVSYGENGLLPLVRMMISAVAKLQIKVRGKTVKFGDEDEPTLRWPAWFAPTGHDRGQEATSLATLASSGHISRETAVKSISSSFDIEDVHAEIKRIENDIAEELARDVEKAAQIKVSTTIAS